MKNFNISVLNQTSYFVNNFKDQISSSLTPLQKKIMLIALAIWSGFTLFFLVRDYCLRNKNIKNEAESLSPKKVKEKLNAQNDSLNNQNEKIENETLSKREEVEGIPKNENLKNQTLKNEAQVQSSQDICPQRDGLSMQNEKVETETLLAREEENNVNSKNEDLKNQKEINEAQSPAKIDDIDDATLIKNQNAMFDSVQSFFGKTGRETAELMVKALNDHSLSMTFDANKKKFTVIGSSQIDKNDLQKIFQTNSYGIWRPQVLDDVDHIGNRLVNLVQTPDDVLRCETLAAKIKELGRNEVAVLEYGTGSIQGSFSPKITKPYNWNSSPLVIDMGTGDAGLRKFDLKNFKYRETLSSIK